VGSRGEKTLRALREAGLRRLYEQGFYGMTLRELASDIGVQAGSLYNYFANKQDFLYQLLHDVLCDLIDEVEDRLADATNPKDALSIFIDCHVSFHSSRREEVRVSNMELRSLTPENYHDIIQLRDRYEGQLKSILLRGNAEKCWKIADPDISTKLIIGMMTSVGGWYKPNGKYRISDLVKIYQDMIHNLLENTVTDGRVDMHSIL
jgi:AcrR family transcriptional regulator